MTPRVIRVRVGQRWYTVEVPDLSASPVEVRVDGETYLVEVEGLSLPTSSNSNPSPSMPASPPAHHTPPPPPPRQPAGPLPVAEKLLTAPMPARVIAVNVRPGDKVSAGQEVCVLEAMKMEQSIRAPMDGAVKTVHITPLQQVATNDPLVELE